MTVQDRRTLAEITSTIPAASTLFDLLGIDYVCRGNLTLTEGCALAGIDAEHVRRSLDQLPPRGPHDANWLDAPLDAILHELRERRHPRLHDLLRRIAACIAALVPSEAATPRVEALRKTFRSFCDCVDPHLMREEHVFFPIAQHLDDCWSRGAAPEIQHVGGTAKAVAALIMDHERIFAALDALASSAVAVAEVVRETEPLVNSVAVLEHELHEHMHIENNILFPRLTALEVEVVGSSLPQ